MRGHAHVTIVTPAFSKSSVIAVHSNAFSILSTLESVFRKFRFRCPKTLFQCGGKAKPDKKQVAFSNLFGLVWMEPINYVPVLLKGQCHQVFVSL